MSEGFRVTIQVLKANLQPIFMDVKTPLCPQLKGNSLEKAHERLGPGSCWAHKKSACSSIPVALEKKVDLIGLYSW